MKVYYKPKFLYLITLIMISQKLFCQIIIDESYDDWNSISNKTPDPINDTNGLIDFKEMNIWNDSVYLYINFEINSEVNLQESSKILLNIDIDNNSNTGKSVNGIGADIVYDYGQRTGYYIRNGIYNNFSHVECSLLTLPTVTSGKFEQALKRKFNVGNYLVNLGNKIRVSLSYDSSGGDIIPNQSGGYLYQMNGDKLQVPVFSIKKKSVDHLRLMSLNVKQDGYFTNEAPYKRIIKSISADIFCFQEIYDHSSSDVLLKIKNYFGGNWFDAKVGTDIIVVSKYPILNYTAVGGNGAFLIDYKGKELLLINVHLYCCDNDTGRQTEVDEIMSFIKKAKSGTGTFPIKKNTPIIITGDTNFVGKNRQRKTLIEGDIMNENSFGSDFLPDWDNSFFEDAKPVTTGYPGSFTWKSNYSDYPAGRLDYILYSGSVLKIENTYTLNTDLLSRDILEEFQMNNEDSYNSSDHLPVVADFTLKDISATNNIENESSSIDIYPNPTNEIVNVDINKSKVNINKILICNSEGIILKEIEIEKKIFYRDFTINISSFAPEDYYMIFVDKSGKILFQRKFVKVK
jgi:exonuclease III